MLPSPHSRPDYLAPRGVLLSAFVGMALLVWHGRGVEDAFGLLQDTLVVDAMGNTLSEALAGRSVATLLLVLGAMTVAFCSGMWIALTAGRLSPRLLGCTSLLGQGLAALPVAGLGWWAMSWVVTDANLPVESLIPYVPPPDRDHWTLALGRSLWAWLLPMWVLALPLLGESLHTVSDQLRVSWPVPNRLGMQAAGQDGEAEQQHWLRLAWASLLDRWHSLGLLALGYTVLVEHAFGLPGWGGFFSNSLQTGHSAGIAASIYACGWLAAVWAGLSALLRSCTTDGGAMPAPSPSTVPDHASYVGALVMTVFTVMAIGLVVPYDNDSWVRAMFQPWVYGFVPAPLATQVEGLLPALRSDLQIALLSTALALTVAVIRGGMAWLSHGQDRMPKPQFLEVTCWSPLLVWSFAFTATTVAHEPLWLALGLLGGTTGARQLRDLGIVQRAALHVDAARVAGVPRWPRWRRHVLPPLLHWLGAWTLQMLGTTLLWSVLLRSLSEPGPGAEHASLGSTLISAKDHVLGDPSAASLPTVITAIAVLYFWRLARMVG